MASVPSRHESARTTKTTARAPSHPRRAATSFGWMALSTAAPMVAGTKASLTWCSASPAQPPSSNFHRPFANRANVKIRDTFHGACLLRPGGQV
ncbi:hypothetical protein PJL18_03173 [Paenarthrobacter nicotinovorans]|nr:hypothetical protein [Paenarthrobacter nicotinovorans]